VIYRIFFGIIGKSVWLETAQLYDKSSKNEDFAMAQKIALHAGRF
jgi:hypothetical protein